MTRFPQSAKTTRRIGEFLSNPDSKSGSRLGDLMHRAAYLIQLESLLSGLVDPDLAAHFQLAAARKNRPIVRIKRVVYFFISLLCWAILLIVEGQADHKSSVRDNSPPRFLLKAFTVTG